VPPKGGRKHPQQEFLQVDTTNILFICGGAFVGLEDIIEQRIGQKQIGFGAKIVSKRERKVWEYLKDVQPEDLLKYGMIPEFIGRLPVIAPLHELSEEALVQILTQPKNALVKQYQKLFEMDGVKIKFGKGALVKVASMAAAQKSGARGLRAILETALLEATRSTIDLLTRVRHSGVRIGVDDFGTGYASLTVLQSFAGDTLKIDRSFIGTMHENPGHRAIVRGIVALAHNLEMHVVAEGIEHPEQLALLRSIGCEYGQGYLFAGPMDAGELEPTVAAWDPACHATPALELSP